VPLIVEQKETTCLIRLEGDCGVMAAGELRRGLIEWLAAGKDLELDLGSAGDIDVAVLQLLWSAEREVAQHGSKLVSRLSETALQISREAGFDLFSGPAAEARVESAAGAESVN
jgi:hypothetical protein